METLSKNDLYLRDDTSCHRGSMIPLKPSNQPPRISPPCPCPLWTWTDPATKRSSHRVFLYRSEKETLCNEWGLKSVPQWGRDSVGRPGWRLHLCESLVVHKCPRDTPPGLTLHSPTGTSVPAEITSFTQKTQIWFHGYCSNTKQDYKDKKHKTNINPK